MILVGAPVGFYIGKPILDKAKASTNWPTVDGKVIESKLKRRKKSREKDTYEAVVIYQYEVDGESFEGDSVWAGQYSSSSRSSMQKIVSQYRVGADVSVYYSPDDPYEAVLQPGAFASSYMVFGIGMLFLVFGCILVVVPIIKLVFLTAVVATSASSSFAGGGTTAADDAFRFDTNSNDDDDNDDDAFGDIPG